MIDCSAYSILLTGGTGFLGRHLLRQLLSCGYRVVLLKRTASRVDHIAKEFAQIRAYDCDVPGWHELFRENSIDLIVHCATNYGRQSGPIPEIVEANLTLPLRLLQLGGEHGVRGFINSDTVLDKRISYYTLSKSQFLEWFGLFDNTMTCVNVALEHFYGPFDDPSKFVTWIVRELLRGVERIDLTPGEQRREFVYIDDVVNAYLRIIEFGLQQSGGSFRFEVGNKQRCELREFVRLAKRLAGNTSTELAFGALSYRPNEVMESASNTAALEALGWKTDVSLEQGLMTTIVQEREAGAR